MKPYERDWEFHSGCWPEVVFYKGGNKKVCDVWADEDSSTCDVADLISAAPDMARMLLDIQWTPTGYDHEPCCPICSLSKPKPGLARDDAHFPHGHAKDCALLAVLLKAGVIADKERST